MKKKTLTQVKKLIWEECKRIVRAKYQKEDGTWDCFTCGRRIDEPSKAQTNFPSIHP